jgi:hypothetical protein
MKAKKQKFREQEYDFALIVGGVPELTRKVTDALFEAGCDDATLSIQYGLLYVEFSRTSTSLLDAIVDAIGDVLKADIGATVLRVDESSFVSASDIARRIGRSRQMVHQYMTGVRGPGSFPPPTCHLADHAPLWAWCAVCYWLLQNKLIEPEECKNAETIEAVNAYLDRERQRARCPDILKDVDKRLRAAI